MIFKTHFTEEEVITLIENCSKGEHTSDECIKCPISRECLFYYTGDDNID
jgi:hypothetical protein